MNENRVLIPVSILVAVVIIILAVVFSNKEEDVPNPIENPVELPATEEIAIRPVTADDHILGSLDADIIIVEYSDYECPFCAKHHPTMERIIDEYGKDGKVAWVYRHYPLEPVHTKARPASEASECVANLAGETAFWNFGSQVFANQPASLTPNALKEIAIKVGTDKDAYEACVAANTYAADVEEDKKDGDLIASIDTQFGTPYSLLITKSGLQIPLRGAQPYDTYKQYIDLLLSESENDSVPTENTPEVSTTTPQS